MSNVRLNAVRFVNKIKLRKKRIILQNVQISQTGNAFKKHSADELSIIVKNYQKGDANAAEQLRQQFYPLIYKLSHRQSMYSIFGEDAENMAWVLFFEFIFTYKGHDFIRLPGLIRRFLIFRLLRLMQQQGSRWDAEEYLENETFVDVPVECEPLQRLLNNTTLQEEFLRLPKNQMQVLEELYFKNNTQEEIARVMNCTSRSVRTYKNLALARLKKQLQR